MITGTHVAFSTALYLGGAAILEYPADPIAWGLTAFASILPDVDLPTSRVGRPLFWLSTRLEKRFGHRTVTHSVFALILVVALAFPLRWLGHPAWFWAIVGGYWSHLWIDMLNIRGVDLFWPSPVRVVMPSRIQYRMEVGSKAEMVLMTALFVACLALYPISKMGVRGGLHQVFRDFDMAVEEYREQAGARWFTLDLAAIDNLTLEHIRCRCAVLGAWQNGLIVEYQGQSRAVGKSQLHHNLYPTEAVLVAGEPLSVQTQRVDMKGRSLGWLMERLQGLPNVYLLGELWIDADKVPAVTEIDLYRPVWWSGDRIRLHYARAEDLREYRRLVAIRGEVMVQSWAAARLPELGRVENRSDSGLPRGLEGLF